MENTIDTLEKVHRDLVERLEDGEADLAVVVASVPQLVGLVARYEPKADAVIMSRAELADLVTAVVVDVLETQTAKTDRVRRRVSLNPSA